MGRVLLCFKQRLRQNKPCTNFNSNAFMSHWQFFLVNEKLLNQHKKLSALYIIFYWFVINIVIDIKVFVKHKTKSLFKILFTLKRKLKHWTFSGKILTMALLLYRVSQNWSSLIKIHTAIRIIRFDFNQNDIGQDFSRKCDFFLFKVFCLIHVHVHWLIDQKRVFVVKTKRDATHKKKSMLYIVSLKVETKLFFPNKRIHCSTSVFPYGCGEEDRDSGENSERQPCM